MMSISGPSPVSFDFVEVTIKKTPKSRLEMTAEQRGRLEQFAGTARFASEHALDRLKSTCQETGKPIPAGQTQIRICGFL